MRIRKATNTRSADGTREVAIVTGVLVLEPVGAVGGEKIAGDAIIPGENLSEDVSGE